jgi:hypothetical protein
LTDSKNVLLLLHILPHYFVYSSHYIASICDFKSRLFIHSKLQRVQDLPETNTHRGAVVVIHQGTNLQLPQQLENEMAKRNRYSDALIAEGKDIERDLADA